MQWAAGTSEHPAAASSKLVWVNSLHCLSREPRRYSYVQHKLTGLLSVCTSYYVAYHTPSLLSVCVLHNAASKIPGLLSERYPTGWALSWDGLVFFFPKQHEWCCAPLQKSQHHTSNIVHPIWLHTVQRIYHVSLHSTLHWAWFCHRKGMFKWRDGFTRHPPPPPPTHTHTHIHTR